MEKLKLTQEEYDSLRPYEKNLVNAYKHSFVHMEGSDFQKVAEIYAKVFGEALTKSQMGCNTCRLNALRKLGELFCNHGTEEKKKKGGRPKKLKNEEETGNESR